MGRNMIKRRSAAIAAAAGLALALAPAAAFAYVPTDIDGGDTSADLDLVCSETSVDPAADFTCTASSTVLPDGTAVTLAAEHADGTPGVAGIAYATKSLSGGQAVFNLTAPDVTTGGNISIVAFYEPAQGGSYEFEGVFYNAATPGIVAVAITEPADATDGDSASAVDDRIAEGGFGGAAIALTAGALLVGGAGAVALATRRRNNEA